MKKLILTFVIAIIATASSFACDLDGLMRGNTTLAKKVKNYERQGYVVVLDQSYFNHHRYLIAPTAPYQDGFGAVILRRSQGGLSLTTEYVTISFNGDVKNNGRCTTSITDITTQTIY